MTLTKCTKAVFLEFVTEGAAQMTKRPFVEGAKKQITGTDYLMHNQVVAREEKSGSTTKYFAIY